MKPLFIFQAITPELIQEIIEGEKHRDFDKIPEKVQRRYADIAQSIRSKASLCALCGKQAPLDEDGVCEEGCLGREHNE